VESSDVRRILEKFRDEVNEGLIKLYEDIKGAQDLDRDAALWEFRKWAQEVVNQEYEGLRNGTK